MPAPAQTHSPSICNGTFKGMPPGSVNTSLLLEEDGGSPIGDGALISAGSRVTVRITWDPADWVSTAKLQDCYMLDGAAPTSLDFQEKPTANDGSFLRSLVVPEGSRLCERAKVSGAPTGANGESQKGNTICIVMGPPPGIPEVPLAVALPVSGALVLGLALVVVLRRQRIDV